MLSPKGFRNARAASAALMVIVGVRHAVLAVNGQSDVTRHWVFVVINVAFGALLVLRPRWAFFPTLALGIQQTVSHGLDLSQSFLGTVPLDVTSLAVCLFFPTLVTVLFIERQEEKERGEVREETTDT